MIAYVTKSLPSQVGVYACRVESELVGWYEDEFLIWSEGAWFYKGSDQRFRGRVAGWVGPLKRNVKVGSNDTAQDQEFQHIGNVRVWPAPGSGSPYVSACWTEGLPPDGALLYVKGE